jgi:hypothetical protein
MYRYVHNPVALIQRFTWDRTSHRDHTARKEDGGPREMRLNIEPKQRDLNEVRTAVSI